MMSLLVISMTVVLCLVIIEVALRGNFDWCLGGSASNEGTLPTPPAKRRILGATPAHYRALTLVGNRCRGEVSSLVYEFRQRAKEIKLVEAEASRAEALRLMDHFAQLAEAYVPLWDNASDDERPALQARLAENVRDLDTALAEILSPSQIAADRFETVTRFVGKRYGDEGAPLGIEAALGLNSRAIRGRRMT